MSEKLEKALKDLPDDGPIVPVNCPSCDVRKDLEAEVERLLMSRARKDAMLAVYMQAIATRARSGEQEWAQDIVRRADEAALRVKRSDLTVATVSAEAQEDGDE